MGKYRSPFKVKARCTGGYPYYNSPPGSSTKHNTHTGEDWVPTVKTNDNWSLCAIDDCTVIDAKSQKEVPGFWGGNYITYKCDGGLYVFYAHMAEPSPFKAGDRISKGTFIAHAGGTGAGGKPDDFGTHLHIEVSTVGYKAHPSKFGGKQVYGLFRGPSSRGKPSDYIDFYSGQSISTYSNPTSTNSSNSTDNPVPDMSRVLLTSV